MAMQEMIVENIMIEMTRKRVKHLRLAVYPTTGRVRVVVPLRIDAEKARLFVISKISWIKKHLEKFPKHQQDKINNNIMMKDSECREKLKVLVPDLITKWQAVIGVEIAEWRIKKMKTRWGTCNTNARRIWINLELAKKSLNCLEYIIVHELVHLLERSHNYRFKGFMDKFMPEWRSYRRELKSGSII